MQTFWVVSFPFQLSMKICYTFLVYSIDSRFTCTTQIQKGQLFPLLIYSHARHSEVANTSSYSQWARRGTGCKSKTLLGICAHVIFGIGINTLWGKSVKYMSVNTVSGWFVRIQTSLYNHMWSHNNNEFTFCHSLCHINKNRSLTGEILTLLIFTFPFDICEN
jgi:hypothetical protein